MTLFIACLLIYHMNLEPVWYGVAVAVWLTHFGIVFYVRRTRN